MIKLRALTLLALTWAATASAQTAALETANSCQLVAALDTAGRITFRDGSYVTRKPTERNGVLLQEQFGRTGRLRYRAEVSRKTGTDTVSIFDPNTYKTSVMLVRFDGYASAGAYTCYEMDGRGYSEGELYTGDSERETPYRQVYSNGKTGASGSLRAGKDSVGTWRINDEQGRLVEEITFVDGKRVGPYRLVDISGTTLRKGQYYRGEAVDTIMVFDPDTYETKMRLVALSSSPCGTWQIRGADGALKEEEYAPCNE